MVLCLASSITLLQTIAFLIVYNSYYINEQNKTKEQIAIMMQDVNDLQNGTILGLDIGLKSIANSKKEELVIPLHTVISVNDSIFKNLFHQAEFVQFPKANIDSMYASLSDYINLCFDLRNNAQKRGANFENILASDPGSIVWNEYDFYRKEVLRDLEEKRSELNNDIKNSLTTNLVLQILVIVLIVPSLIFLFYKLNRLQKDVFIQNSLVSQKNSELQNSNYFVSHIIRGPICRLNGLFYLLGREKVTEQKELLEKNELVGKEIDDLIKNNWNYLQK